MSHFKIKPVFRWSPDEQVLRLFRILWNRGHGPGNGYSKNYSAKLSFALAPRSTVMLVGVRFVRYNAGDERYFYVHVPCLMFRIHYLRSYGGQQA